MGFNERTGSWCSHCNLLVKQWIVLSRLTKALFFPPVTFFFKWRIQWRGLSCSYQQAMKWGTSASLFNSFVCSLRELNRSLKVHTGEKTPHNRKKTPRKTTQAKRQTVRVKKKGRWEHGSEGFATMFVQHLFPVLRVHRAFQWIA